MDPADDGDCSDLYLAEATAVPAPHSASSDYDRHLRAEARWQSLLAARRLWAGVVTLFAAVKR